MSKRESRRRRKRRTKAYRQAMIIINLCFTCFIVVFFIVGIFHIFTHKREYRDEGVALYEQGDYEAALLRFDDALDCKQWFADKLNVDIELYRADCYIKLSDFVSANKVYEKVEKEYSARYYNKEEVRFLAELTISLDACAHGNYVTTVSDFTKACDKGYTEMSLYAALCYEKQNNYESMKQYYDIYSQNHGMNDYLYYKYASYYILMEDYNQALTYINQGLADGSSTYRQDIRYAEILCYEKQNDYERAYTLAQAYAADYPEDLDGSEMLAFLETRVHPNTEPVNDIYNNDSE